jgi:hypothetical protein
MRVTGDGNRTLTPREEGLPNINMTAFAGFGSGNVMFNTNETSEVAESVSINRGKHNFKFGGQWRHSPVVNEASNQPRGQITFSPDINGIPDAFAAFLLGIPLNANSAEGVPTNDIHQEKFGLYWLDDWKATPRLTINYGVRWDWFGPVTDANGRIRNLSFAGADVQTIGGVSYPKLVPNPLVSEALYDINWRQIMPRLGIVYRLSERTVIRTGSGLFYSPQQTNNFNILGLNRHSRARRCSRMTVPILRQRSRTHSPDRLWAEDLPRSSCSAGQRRSTITARCISTTKSGSGLRRSNTASVRTS